MKNIIVVLLLVISVFKIQVETGPVKTSTPIISANPDAEATQKVTEYLRRYSRLIVPERSPDEVSSTGEGGSQDEVDITQTPAYIEKVMWLQELNGIEPDGDATEELVNSLNASRCGVSDPPSDPNAPGAYTVKAMWDSKYVPQYQLYPLTFSFLEKKNIPDEVTIDSVKQGILSAMCVWESNSNLRFKNIGDENLLADITVSFQEADHGDFYAFDGRGGTLAHAFYPENGILHFDKQETWYLAQKGKVERYKKDIFTVAAHEFGHNIGLMHSKKSKSLMAPVYRYFGTFEEFELPQDDIDGIIDMYGPRVDSDPVTESGTACRELYETYGITRKGSKQPPRRVAVRRPKPQCNDDKKYQKYCGNWKRGGYCDRDSIHIRTMYRRCKNTCGFCTMPIPQRKPLKEEEVGKLTSSVCGISKFDSVAVVLDARNYVEMYYFKGESYFESSVRLESDENTTYSLLNSSETLSDVLEWRTDPKAIKKGLFKYKQADFLEHSDKMSTLLAAKLWYLTFGEDGKVHQYYRGTPSLPHVSVYSIESLFPEYPHESADAAFVEYDVGTDKDTIYSLFHHNKIWQYQEDKSGIKVENPQKQLLKFIPISSMSGVNIEDWHGVPACNLDAVFSYHGVPYFLKGNTFWPATASEPPVPRDITYYFLRCWVEEPIIEDIPWQCDAVAAGQNDGGNGAEHLNITRISALISFFALLMVF